MIDVTRKEPFRVNTITDAPAYIRVPVQQLVEVRRLLDAHEVRYWVDEIAISLNGKPSTTVVNISQNEDASSVQRILDEAVS